MRRYELTDEQFARIEPLLPPRTGPDGGRPWEDHRRIINGVLWVLRSGAPWRDVPERYGPWQTVYDRFNFWRKDGTWALILAHLQAERDAAGGIDWSLFSIDGTHVRAARCAGGASKKALIRRSRRITV
jgi:transposase